MASLTPKQMWVYNTGSGKRVYSTPIATTVQGQKVIAFQGYNENTPVDPDNFYVLRASDGQVVLNKQLAGPNYGRPQAADVNGDGKMDFFAATHGDDNANRGRIYSFNEDGTDN